MIQQSRFSIWSTINCRIGSHWRHFSFLFVFVWIYIYFWCCLVENEYVEYSHYKLSDYHFVPQTRVSFSKDSSMTLEWKQNKRQKKNGVRVEMKNNYGIIGKLMFLFLRAKLSLHKFDSSDYGPLSHIALDMSTYSNKIGTHQS